MLRFTANLTMLFNEVPFLERFALAAKVLGEAAEVTGVDLDEKAIAQAKRNASAVNCEVRPSSQFVETDTC